MRKLLKALSLLAGLLGWGSAFAAATSGTLAGHEGIQLWANGPYWATMNCGATKATEAGYYYLNNNDTIGYMVKNGALKGSLVKNSSRTLWGDGWRMPTTAEAQTMKANCKITSTGKDANGQPYVVVSGTTSGYTDKSIIIPLAGYGNGGSVSDAPNRWGTYGKYWTSNSGIAQRLSFTTSSIGNDQGGDIGHGNYYTVRLVCDTVTPSAEHAHTWGTPSYTWNQTSTGYACVAAVACSGDASHTQSQTVAATYQVIQDSTTTATGTGRWTATFSNTAFTTQAKDVTIARKESSGGETGGQTGGQTTGQTGGQSVPAYKSANFYVATTGSDSAAGTKAAPFATIAKAVAAASAGDKICVMKGTYNVVASGAAYADSAAIIVDKAVTIYGETGNPADVIVHNTKAWSDTANYNQCYRVFKLNNAGAVISGITVENGISRGSMSEPKFFGSNIKIDTNGGVVTNCIVRNGRIDSIHTKGGDPSDQGGGAIACFSSNGLITHCVVSNNFSSMGRTSPNQKNQRGGTAVLLRAGTLRESLIAYNTVSESWTGSAVYAEEDSGATTRIENCTIAYNKYVDGGRYGNYNDSGELYPIWIPLNTYDGTRLPEVRNCLIYGNQTHGGGKVLIDWSKYADAQFKTTKTAAMANSVNLATDMTVPSGMAATAVTASDMDGLCPKEGTTLASKNVGCTWLGKAAPNGESAPGPDETEPSDPEPSDPEPSDPEPTDPEPGKTDPEPTDPKPTDPEPSNPGVSGTLAGHEGVRLWANGPYWATMNCGATKVGQTGSYFYNWNDTVGYSVKGGALTGSLVKNASTTFWTGGWRKPTGTDYDNLIKYAKVDGVMEIDGQPCAKVRGTTAGYTDKYIILPLSGWGNGGNAGKGNAWGSMGKYWVAGSSGILQHLTVSAGGLGKASGGADHGNYYTLRLVCDSVTASTTPGTTDPGTDKPGADKPGTDKPGTTDPGTDKPGTDKPGTTKPEPEPEPETGLPTTSVKNPKGVQLWENGPYWATANLGAAQETDYGFYYIWGGTTGYYYSRGSWRDQDGASVKYPFNGNIPEAKTDAKGNLAAANDAARQLWGGKWRLPTAADRDGLSTKCTFAWTVRNGVAGGLFTGKGAYADRSIFIPAAGYATRQDGPRYKGKLVYLYTSSLAAGDGLKAASYSFTLQTAGGSGTLTLADANRSNGYVLRAVYDPETSGSGATNSGTSGSGTSGSGATNSGTSGSGTSGSGSTNSGTTGSGTTTPGSGSTGTTDPGSKPGDADPADPSETACTLFDAVSVGGLEAKAAAYNGFLGEDALAGSFTLAVKKPRRGETSASATLTKLDASTGKKLRVKGTVDVATGVCGGDLAGLKVGPKGLTGTLAGAVAQGAVDAVKAKDAGAIAVMNGFSGRTYAFILEDAEGGRALLTAAFSAKGRVKVSGTVAGRKVSGKSQMEVGDRCAVPFAYARRGVAVTFVMWFDKTTRELLGVSALGRGVGLLALGLAENPAAGGYTLEMSEADVLAAVPDAVAETPLAIPVAYTGAKYAVEGDNAARLRLRYAKGALSGSFTVTALTNGRRVKSTFAVSGLVIDGVGYAVGTNSRLGSIPVTLK